MAQNTEIKAAARCWEAQRAIARRLADAVETLEQDDTFYRVPEGRLKLRRLGGGAAQLIFYRRPDAAGAKVSWYEMAAVAEPAAVGGVLTRALGEAGRVRKRRTCFHVGPARVHFDEVEGIGRFIEIEVADQPEVEGRRIVGELRGALGIADDDLVAGAYADLFV